MKPPVRLLIPVWGERYVRRFAALSLPSLLAPGNLPALAEMTNLEFVILTSARDATMIESDAAFRALRAIVAIRFITIDDLIIDQVSGVILTLAYFRGVAETGDDMVNRHFLFLNSDIVLADGSLRSVAQRILEGRRIVLANSVRAVSEDLEAPLRRMVEESAGVLAIPPRELVGLALQAMHPLQIAKIVNNDLCHSVHINQLYWQVDRHTLISRHFLMFMLCLKPERVVHEIQAFCDYAFVAEFCPSGGAVAMDDSDEFFALEMQPRESEAEYLRLGPATPQEIAASLSDWTTQVHRDDSLNHTLIFHARDLPPETAEMCREADRYVRDLHRLIAPEPKPFRGHPYWVGARHVYDTRRAQLRGTPPPAPAQLPAAGSSTTATTTDIAAAPADIPGSWLYRKLFGVPPFVSILHPDWPDYRAITALLSEHRGRADQKVLYLNAGAGRFGPALGHAKRITMAEILDTAAPSDEIAPRSLTLALAELGPGDFARGRKLADRLEPLVRSGGQIVLYFKESAPDPKGDLAEHLRRVIAFLAPRDLHRAQFSFTGTPVSKSSAGISTGSSASTAAMGWQPHRRPPWAWLTYR